jgi:hypothetical protein
MLINLHLLSQTLNMIGKTVQLQCGESYFFSPVHRQSHPTNDKCIWTIDIPEEIACFNSAFIKTWYEEGSGWGIRFISKNNFEEVGINYENRPLYIAKFIQDSGVWHGYPADINKRPHDRPSPIILDRWLENNIISKPYRSRIQGGRL